MLFFGSEPFQIQEDETIELQADLTVVQCGGEKHFGSGVLYLTDKRLAIEMEKSSTFSTAYPNIVVHALTTSWEHHMGHNVLYFQYCEELNNTEEAEDFANSTVEIYMAFDQEICAHSGFEKMKELSARFSEVPEHEEESLDMGNLLG